MKSAGTFGVTFFIRVGNVCVPKNIKWADFSIRVLFPNPTERGGFSFDYKTSNNQSNEQRELHLRNCQAIFSHSSSDSPS